MSACPLFLSVVIPTHNRLESLKLVLQELAAQTQPAETFEVLVTDDGSSDGTAAFLAASPRYSFSLRSWRVEGKGAAAARNRAIAEARAPRVLMLGDDTPPEADLLRRHLDAGRDGVGIQGRIAWDETEAVTPVMEFLAPAGPQFYFRGLSRGETVPYTIQYGANLSAPTRWFLEEPFDEGFPAAAFEDTELAFRWRRRGFTVIYRDDAVCNHRHPYSGIDEFLQRSFVAGRAARYAVGLHPAMALRTVLQPFSVGVYHGLRHLLRRLQGRARKEDSWDLRCRAAFFRGFLSRRGATARGGEAAS
jgi:glycosyltransferase involved in cell wall biosynthesis